MEKRLNIAFLWHHHQPYYKISTPGEKPFFKLPWVRLHAVKDYYDMAAILRDYPRVKQAFNFVPSLLVQLTDYVDNEARDRIMELSLRDASNLSDEEKAELLDTFFLANRVTMIDPYPRYRELFLKKQNKQPFAVDDWRDLQAWYNLCWTGNQGKHREPAKSLFEKGRQFTTDDIRRILDFHRETMASIVSIYKEMADTGQIELTVTPFYHPILPLLCDTRISDHSARNVLDQSASFTHPEDCDHQISLALRYFSERFGFTPSGMWPSEGSVSKEAVQYFAKHRIRWIATDEAILYHSTTSDENPTHLKPYRMGGGPAIFFRDHAMSDAIGFVYAGKPAREAVDDFMQRAEAHRTRLLNAKADPSKHCLSVILDGENCWEYYPDQGETFLKNLFQALSSSTTLESVTFSDFLDNTSSVGEIKKLHAGSWINHNFDIWYGTHPEKNTAWQYLSYARNAVKAAAESRSLNKEQLQRAWEAIYIAEGSDWFWWFGDDHQAHNKHLFDELFRFYLRTAHEAIGEVVPSYLRAPIMTRERARRIHRGPTSSIRPRVDGKSSHFYEWLDAGMYDAEADGDTMHATEKWIKKLYYGFDESFLYLRVDFFDSQTAQFRENPDLQIRVQLNGTHLQYGGGTSGENAVLDEILEIRFPLKDFQNKDTILVSVSVWEGQRELVRRPAREPLSLLLNTESDKYLWSI